MTAAIEAAVAAAGLPNDWAWRVEVRPRRRTLGLDVFPDGSILIAVPPGAEPETIADTVRARRRWLARAIQRRHALAAEHPAKEIIDGEGFSYLGRHYRLLLVGDQDTPVKLRAGWLRLRAPVDEQAGAAAIVYWYVARGERWLIDRVRTWAGRVGTAVPPVAVHDVKSRWGMRYRDGSVAFHWAVMQLQPELVDLVVVHELVHLLEPRHDHEFRRRLLLALPEAAELEGRLADAGRHLWLGQTR